MGSQMLASGACWNVVADRMRSPKCCCRGPVVLRSVINKSPSIGLPIVFSCLFFKTRTSLRSLSRRSGRNRNLTDCISFSILVALALSAVCKVTLNLRQISKPCSVSSHRAIALAEPSIWAYPVAGQIRNTVRQRSLSGSSQIYSASSMSTCASGLYNPT